MKNASLWSLISIVVFTAVFSVSAQSPYTMRLQTFQTGLSRPILLRTAKDGTGRIFILQQGGIIRVLQPGATTPTDFMNISSKIIVPATTGDERGLLGLTFHPQFASNGKFYVNYTRVGDGTTVVAEYKTATGNPNQGDVASERILFTVPQPFSNHNGGMVEFGADGYLYIGMGDGGSANDPGARAQNRAQLLGKLLRIDVNIPDGSPVPYLIPPTNPYVGANTARCDNGSTTAGNTCQEIWTIGMRNPWRWSFDRTTNQMWVADVGQGSIEEVDVISQGGGNYGWRVYEGNTCTNLDPSLCIPGNYIFPLFVYGHTAGRCSITGGYVYRGTLGSLPAGVYTHADYCTGEIWMWQNNAQVLLQDTPRSVVSFGEDDAGEIYVCYNNGQIDRITRAKASADFDGDFRTDISVFRPSNGVWYIINSQNQSVRIQQFGLTGDMPTPEDWDGDNISDIAVFRPSTGVWFNFNSSNNTVGINQFGLNGDIPVQSDFDGDAIADRAVFRPSTGVWYVQKSSNGAVDIQQFGLNGDTPIAADFDRDGKADRGVFRPSTGVWYSLRSLGGLVTQQNFGLSGDIPTVGDYDADGRADIAVFRPTTGVWYRLRSSDGAVLINQFGLNSDIPAVGDYDGDGLDDIAVFRPSTGAWYTQATSNGAVSIQQFGSNGDTPIPSLDVP